MAFNAHRQDLVRSGKKPEIKVWQSSISEYCSG